LQRGSENVQERPERVERTKSDRQGQCRSLNQWGTADVPENLLKYPADINGEGRRPAGKGRKTTTEEKERAKEAYSEITNLSRSEIPEVW